MNESIQVYFKFTDSKNLTVNKTVTNFEWHLRFDSILIDYRLPMFKIPSIKKRYALNSMDNGGVM